MNNGISSTDSTVETALPKDFSVAETQPPSQKTEKKTSQSNTKPQKSKLPSKPIGLLSIVVIGVLGSAVALGAAFVINRSLFPTTNAKEENRSGQWTRAIDLVAPQEVERVVRKSVKLSDGLTIEQIKTKLTARELVSGGETFTIYKFQFPQTCGSLGCLYAIVDKKDGISIPLQLTEIPDGKLFTPIKKAGCFNVRQKNEGIENYEICKPG